MKPFTAEQLLTGLKFTLLNFQKHIHSNVSPPTNQEKIIITFMLRGKRSKEIATELNISIHTVRKHRSNLLKKFNMSSHELIALAIKEGWIKDE